MSNEMPKYKAILETIVCKFNQQISSDDAIDNKSGVLLGFFVAIGLGYANLILPLLTTCSLITGVIGIVALILGIIILFRIVWPKDYASISVDKSKIATEYLSKTEKELIKQLIGDADRNFKKNMKLTNHKVELFKQAIVMFMLAVLFFIISTSTQLIMENKEG